MTTSHRLDFFAMPDAVVAAIEASLESKVVRATNALGGFTPGPASRCELVDGRVVFVKACSEDLSERAVAMLRREATILPQLPADFPAPTFLGSVEAAGWFALISAYVAGFMPTTPFTADVVDRSLALVADLARRGSRCPIADLDRVGAHEQERRNRWAWKQLADEGSRSQLDVWSAQHLEALVELEADWVDAAHGEALLHRDLRTDNMILGPDRAVAVDWPTASKGAAWIDLVGMLPSFHADGGPEPEAVFTSHPVGQEAEPSAVNCYLAALAGYFTRQALLPSPSTGTSLRNFQAEQGRVCRSWLDQRLGWGPVRTRSRDGPRRRS